MTIEKPVKAKNTGTRTCNYFFPTSVGSGIVSLDEQAQVDCRHPNLDEMLGKTSVITRHASVNRKAHQYVLYVLWIF